MRLVLLAASALALLACAEQAPVEEPATPDAPVVAEPAPAIEVTDANALTLEQISERIVGNFRSTQDEKSTLSITADGKWSSGYEGQDSTVSEWKLFTGDQPPAGSSGPFTPASRYLEVKDANGALYYELGSVAAGGFDMFYTARGNNLGYARVP